ncbi:recombinase : Recombinase-related protein OS=Pseudomonas putida (strain KT2440) GN=PP_1118 PE=4 SV=1: Resolvase: Recombinase [Gemmata massiliana]|uniref:Resolvase/invertase-type recombinase catalytic domain-containing protein n=1 Tax=Gemmata massiliana TaxID=1210884 RepID=A0A6P2DLV3_9BACT|nr:recombinase family protein [Gemmata massiliana]VTS01687.1 recombinase : Recombinase-related protein OS=Pseudomonas putida (strain KT2440) GN=PP_1118 PE=4 SV=1: Resolvase: Recombinase [Gemmata massiliana]
MFKNSSKSDWSLSSTPLAYSYIRFSTPEQRKGDSLRRQTKAVTEWCDRNNVRLDISTTLQDLGKSAFLGEHRKNHDRYALAAFLKMVDDGKIPHGSFLVVENLDRLTREHLRAAVTLFLSIQERGVNIVTTSPEKVYRHDSQDMIDIILAVVELSRGHGESARKSELGGKAWRAKRDAARRGEVQPSRREGRVSGMNLLTHKLPLWVEEKGGKLVAIPERAAAVKRIFALGAAGHGAVTIIKQLKQENVKAFSKSGRWSKSYIIRILRDRRALGDYQAHDHGKPDGDPISGYYPAVVTEAEFYAALKPLTARKAGLQPVTRLGKHVNLFAGLLRDAHGGSYNPNTQHTRVLVNYTALEGYDRRRTFPLAVFERALLEHLVEIEPHEIIGGDKSEDEVVSLSRQLDGIESELSLAVRWMDDNGFSAAIAARIRQLEEKKRSASEQLDDAKRRVSTPVNGAWKEFRNLAEVMDKSKNPIDTRVRLRAALRRAIDHIVMLVIPRGTGRDRFCMVTVIFAGGKDRRWYRIWYQSGSNGRPARQAANAFDFGESDDLDLTKPELIAHMEDHFSNMDNDQLQEFLEESMVELK